MATSWEFGLSTYPFFAVLGGGGFLNVQATSGHDFASDDERDTHEIFLPRGTTVLGRDRTCNRRNKGEQATYFFKALRRVMEGLEGRTMCWLCFSETLLSSSSAFLPPSDCRLQWTRPAPRCSFGDAVVVDDDDDDDQRCYSLSCSGREWLCVEDVLSFAGFYECCRRRRQFVEADQQPPCDGRSFFIFARIIQCCHLCRVRGVRGEGYISRTWISIWETVTWFSWWRCSSGGGRHILLRPWIGVGYPATFDLLSYFVCPHDDRFFLPPLCFCFSL